MILTMLILVSTPPLSPAMPRKPLNLPPPQNNRLGGAQNEGRHPGVGQQAPQAYRMNQELGQFHQEARSKRRREQVAASFANLSPPGQQNGRHPAAGQQAPKSFGVPSPENRQLGQHHQESQQRKLQELLVPGVPFQPQPLNGAGVGYVRSGPVQGRQNLGQNRAAPYGVAATPNGGLMQQQQRQGPPNHAPNSNVYQQGVVSKDWKAAHGLRQDLRIGRIQGGTNLGENRQREDEWVKRSSKPGARKGGPVPR